MRIIAERVLGGDLKPGDLFSAAGPEYWDHIHENKETLGERVFIRTANTPSHLAASVAVYRITIQKE